MDKEMVTIETGASIDQKLQDEVDLAVKAANAITINTTEDRQKAYEIAGNLKKRGDAITDFFEPMRKKAHEAKQEILDKKNAALKPIEAAIPIIKKKMTVFDQEQERLRKEAEALEFKKAEEAAAEEIKRLEQEALNAMDEGKEEEAEVKAAEAESVTTESMMDVAQPATLPKGYVANWQAIVVNKRQLLQAALSNPAFFDAVIPDEKWLRQFAKATRGKSPIPGIKFEDTGTVRLS